MENFIDAIFENGVLKPLSPIGLKENQRYRLTLEEATDSKLPFSLEAPHPILGRIFFNEDPSLPLDPEDWPENDDADHH
jgi:predicted DNA-binding antitoxin AbrB/MazE fold protein